jgi:tetrahydromethanopterin S-methyltransferase subunit G
MTKEQKIEEIQKRIDSLHEQLNEAYKELFKICFNNKKDEK